MRTIIALLLIAVLSPLQAQTGSAPQPSSPAAGDQSSCADKNSKKKDKKKKKKKEKKDEKDDALDTSLFSAAVANSVLGDLRDGLEGHMQRLTLSVFDADKMDGYLSFEDQIQALFDRYEGFRVHFRIAQTSIEGARGVVLADFEMEETPRGAAAPPIRRHDQMRFELERGRKGWKIVDFRPRSFFS